MLMSALGHKRTFGQRTSEVLISPFYEYRLYLAPDAELIIVTIYLGSGSAIRCLFKSTIQSMLLNEVLG